MTREEAINNAIMSTTMSPMLGVKEKLAITIILANIQEDLEEHRLLEKKDKI